MTELRGCLLERHDSFHGAAPVASPEEHFGFISQGMGTVLGGTAEVLGGVRSGGGKVASGLAGGMKSVVGGLLKGDGRQAVYGVATTVDGVVDGLGAVVGGVRSGLGTLVGGGLFMNGDARGEDLLGPALGNWRRDQQHVLEVTSVRARGLRACDANGLADPYCTIEVEKVTATSHVEFGTLDPDWARWQPRPFAIHYPSSTLRVLLWDEDGEGSRNDFLGFCSVELCTLKVNEPLAAWFPLSEMEGRWLGLADLVKHGNRVKGEIFLRLRLTTTRGDLDSSGPSSCLSTTEFTKPLTGLAEQTLRLSAPCVESQNRRVLVPFLAHAHETERWHDMQWDGDAWKVPSFLAQGSNVSASPSVQRHALSVSELTAVLRVALACPRQQWQTMYDSIEKEMNAKHSSTEIDQLLPVQYSESGATRRWRAKERTMKLLREQLALTDPFWSTFCSAPSAAGKRALQLEWERHLRGGKGGLLDAAARLAKRPPHQVEFSISSLSLQQLPKWCCGGAICCTALACAGGTPSPILDLRLHEIANMQRKNSDTTLLPPASNGLSPQTNSPELGRIFHKYSSKVRKGRKGVMAWNLSDLQDSSRGLSFGPGHAPNLDKIGNANLVISSSHKRALDSSKSKVAFLGRVIVRLHDLLSQQPQNMELRLLDRMDNATGPVLSMNIQMLYSRELQEMVSMEPCPEWWRGSTPILTIEKVNSKVDGDQSEVSVSIGDIETNFRHTSGERFASYASMCDAQCFSIVVQGFALRDIEEAEGNLYCVVTCNGQCKIVELGGLTPQEVSFVVRESDIVESVQVSLWLRTSRTVAQFKGCCAVLINSSAYQWYDILPSFEEAQEIKSAADHFGKIQIIATITTAPTALASSTTALNVAPLGMALYYCHKSEPDICSFYSDSRSGCSWYALPTGAHKCYCWLLRRLLEFDSQQSSDPIPHPSDQLSPASLAILDEFHVSYGIRTAFSRIVLVSELANMVTSRRVGLEWVYSELLRTADYLDSYALQRRSLTDMEVTMWHSACTLIQQVVYDFCVNYRDGFAVDKDLSQWNSIYRLVAFLFETDAEQAGVRMLEWFVYGIEKRYSTVRKALLLEAAEENKEARAVRVQELLSNVDGALTEYVALCQVHRQQDDEHRRRFGAYESGQIPDTLTITIVRASGLRKSSSTDPFANISFTDITGGRKALKTQTLAKTEDPDWYADNGTLCTYEIDIFRGSRIYLEVFDANWLRDDFIGGAVLATEDFPTDDSVPSEFWVPIASPGRPQMRCINKSTVMPNARMDGTPTSRLAVGDRVDILEELSDDHGGITHFRCSKGWCSVVARSGTVLFERVVPTVTGQVLVRTVWSRELEKSNARSAERVQEQERFSGRLKSAQDAVYRAQHALTFTAKALEQLVFNAKCEIEDASKLQQRMPYPFRQGILDIRRTTEVTVYRRLSQDVRQWCQRNSAESSLPHDTVLLLHKSLVSLHQTVDPALLDAPGALDLSRLFHPFFMFYFDHTAKVMAERARSSTDPRFENWQVVNESFYSCSIVDVVTLSIKSATVFSEMNVRDSAPAMRRALAMRLIGMLARTWTAYASALQLCMIQEATRDEDGFLIIQDDVTPTFMVKLNNLAEAQRRCSQLFERLTQVELPKMFDVDTDTIAADVGASGQQEIDRANKMNESILDAMINLAASNVGAKLLAGLGDALTASAEGDDDVLNNNLGRAITEYGVALDTIVARVGPALRSRLGTAIWAGCCDTFAQVLLQPQRKEALAYHSAQIAHKTFRRLKRKMPPNFRTNDELELTYEEIRLKSFFELYRSESDKLTLDFEGFASVCQLDLSVSPGVAEAILKSYLIKSILRERAYATNSSDEVAQAFAKQHVPSVFVRLQRFVAASSLEEECVAALDVRRRGASVDVNVSGDETSEEETGETGEGDGDQLGLLRACHLPVQPLLSSVMCSWERKKGSIADGTLHIFEKHLIFSSHRFSLFNARDKYSLLVIPVESIVNAGLAVIGNFAVIGFVTTAGRKFRFCFASMGDRTRAYETIKDICAENRHYLRGSMDISQDTF